MDKYLGFGWEVLSSSLDYEKKDAQSIAFKVPVSADDENGVEIKGQV